MMSVAARLQALMCVNSADGLSSTPSWDRRSASYCSCDVLRWIYPTGLRTQKSPPSSPYSTALFPLCTIAVFLFELCMNQQMKASKCIFPVHACLASTQVCLFSLFEPQRRGTALRSSFPCLDMLSCSVGYITVCFRRARTDPGTLSQERRGYSACSQAEGPRNSFLSCREP